MFMPEMLLGVCIPFFGTLCGAACVFFVRGVNEKVNRILTGIAAGVMTAASVWSLLIPSIEQSFEMGKWAFVPAACGYLAGILFLLCIDALVPHLHRDSNKPEGIHSSLSKHAMMFLAVTIHNIPEGMAVGVVFAGMFTGNETITMGAALALAVGIAIQNFPEGAILSIPLHTGGMKKKNAFWFGTLSGIVEPLGTILVIIMAKFFTPLLPYFLSFAAGAMLYVVVEELIPEMSEGEHSNLGVISFSIGFVLMMILDVALG